MEKLQQKMVKFFEERDWGQFHSPKNVVMDLCCEVGELAEHFRWLTEEESYKLSGETYSKVRDEVGDTMIALMLLAEKLGIDVVDAASDKLEKIGRNYPVEKCRGRCDKYTVYQDEE